MQNECPKTLKLVENLAILFFRLQNTRVCLQKCPPFRYIVWYLRYNQINHLIPQTTKQWTESKAKAEYINDVTWRHQLFFSPVLIPSPWDISEAEKAVFGGRNLRNTFGNIFLKFKIVKSWSPGQEVLPQPRSWLEQQDWFTVQIKE